MSKHARARQLSRGVQRSASGVCVYGMHACMAIHGAQHTLHAKLRVCEHSVSQQLGAHCGLAHPLPAGMCEICPTKKSKSKEDIRCTLLAALKQVRTLVQVLVLVILRPFNDWLRKPACWLGARQFMHHRPEASMRRGTAMHARCWTEMQRGRADACGPAVPSKACGVAQTVIHFHDQSVCEEQRQALGRKAIHAGLLRNIPPSWWGSMPADHSCNCNDSSYVRTLSHIHACKRARGGGRGAGALPIRGVAVT